MGGPANWRSQTRIRRIGLPPARLYPYRLSSTLFVPPVLETVQFHVVRHSKNDFGMARDQGPVDSSACRKDWFGCKNRRCHCGRAIHFKPQAASKYRDCHGFGHRRHLLEQGNRADADVRPRTAVRSKPLKSHDSRELGGSKEYTLFQDASIGVKGLTG